MFSRKQTSTRSGFVCLQLATCGLSVCGLSVQRRREPYPATLLKSSVDQCVYERPALS
jgi:hypothetical protein